MCVPVCVYKKNRAEYGGNGMRRRFLQDQVQPFKFPPFLLEPPPVPCHPDLEKRSILKKIQMKSGPDPAGRDGPERYSAGLGDYPTGLHSG